ncbi:MHYT domain-containing protein [Notoacmeibacter sp. MSK16QG-6]|uniref:MHYT domain-containing protein n=1 Tax=Notoacmeibacter sp. MSK16QG-6 TaxID=2957982 RepID=UPI0020A00BC7|nr:MHYT domain-containing protein [Notoacmeibacter sp. MSK16QG-6]MCP1200495.1 LytTR family transcriptional regulator DNA-binding domain-containing protein [Notoacmeibacter sp. MSK16QG-6]
MITPTYDYLLVAASILVSLMASFTGLTLTKGISALPRGRRKIQIVMASLALGGGIWSMHFVAILAMRFPLPIDYDAFYTLGSALIAILMAGIALLIMHFAPRTWLGLITAGVVLGNGIVVMHYVGMSAIRGCLPLYEPTGIAFAVGGASIMGVTAVGVAYAKRDTAHILAGTMIFGSSVVVVHFLAIFWTSFRISGSVVTDINPLIENGTLALLVMFSAFVICGTFLLASTNYVFADFEEAAIADGTIEMSGDARPEIDPSLAEKALSEAFVPSGGAPRIPYERDKRTSFIPADQAIALRAEGHYTVVYTHDEELFCPWSISQAEKRLPDALFLRTHRSYLVNISQVTGFERHKDSGSCHFDGVQSLKLAPVSRGNVAGVREALGL